MRGEAYEYSGFSGGLNLVAPQYELKPSEARDGRNVVSTSRGAVRKRNGNAPFASGSADFDSIACGLSPDLMVVQQGGTVSTISTSGAVASVATGLSASARWNWTTAPATGGQGPFFGVNGVDPPLYVSGLGAGGAWTLAAGGTPPNGQYIKYLENRILLAGDLTNPSRLYGSKILDPRTFASPDGWSVDLDAGDGQVITGISSVASYGLVFKRNKTWVITDSNTGANRRLLGSTGCVSHRSIAETPTGTIWLADDGIYRSRGGSTPERISDRIQPVVDSIIDAQAYQASGVYFEDHYYLSVCTLGTQNNIILDYDLTLDSWWIHSNGATQLYVWRQITQRLMGGRPGLKTVEQFYVPGLVQDSGVNYDTYWSSPFYSFGSPYIRKRLRRIHFDGRGLLQASLSTDFSTGPMPVGTLDFQQSAPGDTFGGSGTFGDPATNFGGGLVGTFPKTIEQQFVYTPGVGRTFSLTIGTNSAAELELESFTFSLTPRAN